jgi:putative transposase
LNQSFQEAMMAHEMKQRHSYTNLLYHLVFRTKHRERFIVTLEEEQNLYSYIEVKAHNLDVFVEEIGGWYEHVHLLLRARPTMALADVYGQLKGFSTHSWRRRYPEKPFKWGDGVYCVTVDYSNCNQLRMYIRNQKTHHETGDIVSQWEPKDF